LAAALRQSQQLAERLPLYRRLGQSVNGGDLSPAQHPLLCDWQPRLLDLPRLPFTPEVLQGRVTPQLGERPALNFADGASRNPHNRGNLLLAEAPKLPLSAAWPDSNREPGRRGTLSRPLPLRIGFPSLAQGQRWLAVTQSRAPPDVASPFVTKAGNPAGATAGQMDANFDQVPRGHRAVGFD
jgi:hypothetical protein